MTASNNRAVSDVIAFVLVFSIIITSVGFIYTVGFGSLADLQQGEQDANAERSMVAFSVAIDDILRERSGDRAADIDLAGETMVVQDEDQYQLEIEVEDSGGTTSSTVDGALVYGFGSDTQIIYMAGAVIRNDPDGAVITKGPRLNCREDERASLTVPDMADGDDRGGVSSDGSVRVEAEIADRLESTLDYPESPSDNGEVDEIRISVENAPADVEAAWERWFERSDNDWELSGDEGVCEFSGDGTVFVRNPEIDIGYIL